MPRHVSDISAMLVYSSTFILVVLVVFFWFSVFFFFSFLHVTVQPPTINQIFHALQINKRDIHAAVAPAGVIVSWLEWSDVLL